MRRQQSTSLRPAIRTTPAATPRLPHTRVLPVIGVLVALLMTGCAGQVSGTTGGEGDPAAGAGDGDTGSEALDTLRIPVRPESPETSGQQVIRTASLRGKLGGTVGENGTACLWVEARSGVRTALVWPHGYSAASDPLRVMDADGQPVATAGDQVSIAGGATRESFTPEDPEPLATCGEIDRRFSVDVIRQV